MKFVLVLILVVAFSGIAVLNNHAFADRSTVTIEPVAGSGIAGCQDDGGCYIPMVATVDVGGVVIFQNTDTVAHTFTAGTPEGGPSGVFDSGLALVGSSFEYTADTVGEIPHFCIVHPWMTGLIVVTGSAGVSGTAFSDVNGNGKQDAGEAGIPGLEALYVNLADFSMTGTILTDDRGVYRFEIPAGGYLIQINGTDLFEWLTIPDSHMVTKNFGSQLIDACTAGYDLVDDQCIKDPGDAILLKNLQKMIEDMLVEIEELTQRVESLESAAAS